MRFATRPGHHEANRSGLGLAIGQPKAGSRADRDHEYKFLKIRGLRQFVGGSPDARPEPARPPPESMPNDSSRLSLLRNDLPSISPSGHPEIAELARLRCAKRSMTRGHCEVRGGNTHTREAEFPGARFC